MSFSDVISCHSDISFKYLLLTCDFFAFFIGNDIYFTFLALSVFEFKYSNCGHSIPGRKTAESHCTSLMECM